MKEWRTRTAKRNKVKHSAAERWLNELLSSLERLQLAEYIRYVNDTRRLIRAQFLGGVARGVGVAVGFTVLGAVAVMILNRLAQHNLPVIGDFIAQIATIVKRSLEIR